MYDISKPQPKIEPHILAGFTDSSCINECDLFERAWVEIDLTALSHNIQQLRSLLGINSILMAVVKADAYGHGAIAVARTVLKSGASCLGVATVPEGIQLRKAGIKAPILVLGAIISEEQVTALLRWNLEATVCSERQARLISLTLESLGAQLPVHLKIDTGMSRLGVSWEEVVPFGKLVMGLPGLDIASVYSHLATADDPDPTVMELQNQRFRAAVADLLALGMKIPKLHLANSAATLTDSKFHYDMVRIGLAMYGYYPATHLRSPVQLKPVLSVKAKVTQVKTIPAGTGVSYGHKYIATEPTPIAVVGIGYADGVPRQLSNQMQVIIEGKLIPQIGAVAMDQLMLDIRSVPHLQQGDVVTILGKQGNTEVSAEDWADTIGTISWEILCGFKHRLPRVAIAQGA